MTKGLLSGVMVLIFSSLAWGKPVRCAAVFKGQIGEVSGLQSLIVTQRIQLPPDFYRTRPLAKAPSVADAVINEAIDPLLDLHGRIPADQMMVVAQSLSDWGFKRLPYYNVGAIFDLSSPETVSTILQGKRLVLVTLNSALNSYKLVVGELVGFEIETASERKAVFHFMNQQGEVQQGYFPVSRYDSFAGHLLLYYDTRQVVSRK